MSRAQRTLPAALRVAFASWASSELGLSSSLGSERNLDEAVVDAAGQLGLDFATLLDALRRGDPAAVDALTARVTVGETYFFRDPQHFELLGEVLAAADAPVTLWSAGCASGAEAYSMAIVALERLGAAARGRVRVLATDVNEAALSAARAGRFRDWALRGVDPARKHRWLQRDGKEWRIDPRAAELVEFSRHNLARPDGTGPRDVQVAFCRNVLVYFDAEAIARAAATLREALCPGGLLIAGPSDPLLSGHGFAVEPGCSFLAYRRPIAAASEPPPVWKPPPLAVRRFATPPAPPVPAATLAHAQTLAAAGDTAAAIAEVDRFLLDHELSAPGFLLRGLLRQTQGDAARARDDLRRALLLDRNLAYAHLVAAFCHVSLGEHDAARRALSKSKALAAGHPPEEVLDPVSKWTAEELLSACRDLERALAR